MRDPRFVNLARLVEDLLAYWSALRLHHDPMTPAEESPISMEIATSQDQDLTAYAYHVADARLGAVHDHLNSVMCLLNLESPVSFGVLVIARAALESSSRAWRLLDPNITAEARAQRVMTESLHNLRDLQLAEGKVTEQERLRFRFPVFPDRQAEIDAHIARAKAKDWPVVTTGGGFISVGEKRPPSTELANAIIGNSMGSIVYNVMSGATHGGLAGIYDAMQFHPDPDDPGGGGSVEFAPNTAATIEMAVCVALAAAIRAINRQLKGPGRADGWLFCRHHVLTEVDRILGFALDPAGSICAGQHQPPAPKG